MEVDVSCPRYAAAVVSCHTMEYRFVDCRWALDDPGFGRRSTSRAISRARRSSTSSATSPRRPGAGGRHPLPDGRAVRRRRLARGDRAGDVRRRLRLARRRRAALVAAAPLRPRRLRGARPRGLARPARRRRGARSSPPRSSRASATATRSPARSSPRERERAGRRRRAARAALARRAEPGRPRPGPDPRRAERARGTSRVSRAPGGRRRRVLRLGRHRLRRSLHRLHLAGRDGRLYPGSWSEWEQYPELPVERST